MNFIEQESVQKLRGGYYTPPDLAAYVARWALANRPREVLEPSCGDGAFIRALRDLVWRDLSITGFEICEEEAAKARIEVRNVPELTARIYGTDFLGWAIDQIAGEETFFDAVLGNPPFIRYQYLPEEAQSRAELIFRQLHLPFTKHTNAWVPFVLASLALLKPGGRLGMIVPAEIIHIPHSQSLRTYLGECCSKLLIVDPEEIWFEGTLQGAVILFAEKKRSFKQKGEGIGIAKVVGRTFLAEDPHEVFECTKRINGRTVEGKWTPALLTEAEQRLLDQLYEQPEVVRFNTVAKVDVGIVTGANDFFLVDDKTVERFALHKFAYPMFGRSDHCPGVIYDDRQHQENVQKGNPTNLIWLQGLASGFGPAVLDYIHLGEQQELHTRYKCRVRNPWYCVPSVYATRLGMLKRAHDAPRLICNRAGAFTTDTAYRITASGCPPQKLVYCFVNPLTALSAELEGRHYGGGVLELVPSEIERLWLPLPNAVRPKVRALDQQVRRLKMSDVLNEQSDKILGAIGLPRSDQHTLLSGWVRLKNRRQRNASPAT